MDTSSDPERGELRQVFERPDYRRVRTGHLGRGTVSHRVGKLGRGNGLHVTHWGRGFRRPTAVELLSLSAVALSYARVPLIASIAVKAAPASATGSRMR